MQNKRKGVGEGVTLSSLSSFRQLEDTLSHSRSLSLTLSQSLLKTNEFLPKQTRKKKLRVYVLDPKE